MDDKRPLSADDASGPHERGPLEKVGDEIKSWFGDADAAGRRQRDEAAGDHTGKGPEVQLDPDERIVADIGQRLTDDAAIDASRVKADSRDGVVTLSGEVATSAARARAEELATGVQGVHQVDNRLVVV